MTKLTLHSEKRKKEIQDEFHKKYITTSEIQSLVFPIKNEQRNIKRKNRVSDNRNALAQRIANGKYPNAISLKNGYLIWVRDDFYKNMDKKDISKKISSKFTNEFNKKYILAPEMVSIIQCKKNRLFNAIKNKTLPHAFQIPVSRYWLWKRNDIEPYLKPFHEYTKHTRRNRVRKKNSKKPIKSFNDDVQIWIEFIEKTKQLIID
jgi:predicted DNA-binding transcriptional regulator AlpA